MLKFNISDKSVKQVELSIQKKFKALASDQALLSEIGDTIIKDIKFYAKQGKNPKTGSKFRALTDEWKKRRGQISETTATDPSFSKNRSNLTLSGQLLNSMASDIRASKLYIIFEGIHKAYRAKRKNQRFGTTKIGKDIPNKDLAEYVQTIRPFFRVRQSLIPRLKTIVFKYIRRNI
jgi:hypothetical protein